MLKFQNEPVVALLRIDHLMRLVFVFVEHAGSEIDRDVICYRSDVGCFTQDYLYIIETTCPCRSYTEQQIGTFNHHLNLDITIIETSARIHHQARQVDSVLTKLKNDERRKTKE